MNIPTRGKNIFTCIIIHKNRFVIQQKRTSFSLPTDIASWFSYVGVHSVVMIRVDVVRRVFCKEMSTCVFGMNKQHKGIHSAKKRQLNIQPMVFKYNTMKSKLQKVYQI